MKQIVLNLNLFVIIFGLFFLSACTSVDEGNRVKQDHTNNQVKNELNYSDASVYVTAKDTDFRLSQSGNVKFEEFKQPDEHFPTLIIDHKKTFQTIEGFGGALTDASAETFDKLPKEKQNELLSAYFDSEKGIGYNLCRTHINSCDFSSESYAYAEVEGDTELNHFSIDSDKKYRIPFIKEAIAKADGKIKLFASPWSPPAWMKTNNNMLQGGKLKPEYFQVWANYFVKYFEAYAKENIPFWGLTIQNEPMAVQRWESCIYSAENERDFVKNNLGPTLEKAGFGDMKVIIWDHNRGIMYQRAQVVYDDPEASKYVWGTGFHWYVGDHFENVRQVTEAFPDKKTIFTEGCVFPFNYDSLKVWHWGERYGESILKDLNNSAVGWVDWNILLDETGGPNHVANYCYAPIIGDTEKGELIYMNSYYYIGHFSKFIKPGAKRIICSSNYDNLLGTAFINSDGTISVVALNMTDEEIDFKLWIENKGFNAKSLPHSIMTLVFD